MASGRSISQTVTESGSGICLRPMTATRQGDLALAYSRVHSPGAESLHFLRHSADFAIYDRNYIVCSWMPRRVAAVISIQYSITCIDALIARNHPPYK